MSDTEFAPEPPASEVASSETPQPAVVTAVSRGWAITAGALVVLSLSAAATFGILWFSAKSDLLKTGQELVETQENLVSAQGELEAEKAHLVEYERDAKYTACVQFHGGFALGQAIPVNSAVKVAELNCAAESSWEFAIKPAP